jgi:hypothetical protein
VTRRAILFARSIGVSSLIIDAPRCGSAPHVALQQLSHEGTRIVLRCRKRRTAGRSPGEHAANHEKQGRHTAALAHCRE